MKKLYLIAFISLSILNYSTAQAHASDVQPINQNHVEAAGPGVVRIACRRPDSDVLQISRGGIIETADTRRGEVIVTTSHGLRDSHGAALQECWLYAPGGYRVEVTSLTMPDRIVTPDNDWAIIVTGRPFAPSTVRLAPGTLTGLTDAGLPVAMLGPAARDRQCRLSHGVLQDNRAQSLFSHDCRSRPGLSGTPIAVETGDRLFVVALNIGRVLTLGSNIDSRGIALALDGELGSTLAQTIAVVSEPQSAY